MGEWVGREISDPRSQGSEFSVSEGMGDFGIGEWKIEVYLEIGS